MNAYHRIHVAENQKMNSMGYLGMISVPLPHQRPEAAAETQVGDVQDLQQPAFPCSTGRQQHCQATMLSLCRHYNFWSAVLRCQSGMQGASQSDIFCGVSFCDAIALCIPDCQVYGRYKRCKMHLFASLILQSNICTAVPVQVIKVS